MKKNCKYFGKWLITFAVLFSQQIMAMSSHMPTKRAIDFTIAKYSTFKEPLIKAKFKRANIAYPPQKIALLAFKQEKNIELWAKDKEHNWQYIKSYPLTAYSGILGPKLKENDKQIPEGIYHLTMFNPFSNWHLSLMLDYPNEFDKNHALIDRRNKLGNDIFIHGKNSSIGCLAVGDNAIEQIFMLARRVGLDNIEVIIAPNDLRKSRPATSRINQPRWLPELYTKIHLALLKYPLKNTRI